MQPENPRLAENLNIGPERVVTTLPDNYRHYLDDVDNMSPEEVVNGIRELLEGGDITSVTLNIAPHVTEEGDPQYLNWDTLRDYFNSLEDIYSIEDEAERLEEIVHFVSGGEGRFTAWEVYHAITKGIDVTVEVVSSDEIGSPVNVDIADIADELQEQLRKLVENPVPFVTLRPDEILPTTLVTPIDRRRPTTLVTPVDRREPTTLVTTPPASSPSDSTLTTLPIRTRPSDNILSNPPIRTNPSDSILTLEHETETQGITTGDWVAVGVLSVLTVAAIVSPFEGPAGDIAAGSSLLAQLARMGINMSRFLAF